MYTRPTMPSSMFTSWRARLAAALVLASVLACGSSSSDDPKELYFEVNTALLGPGFTDGGAFSVHPPIAWRPVSGDTLARANAMLQSAPGEAGTSTLVALFHGGAGDGHLAVGRHAPVTSAERDSVVAGHGRLLRASVPEEGLRQTSFHHGGYEIDQFMVMDPQTVVVTLFAYHKSLPLYQLDYVVPRESYEKTLAALESSIGSIAFNPQEEESHAP